jgi:hypothetical protein
MSTATREAFTYWVCVDCYTTHHGVREDHYGEPDREPLALIGEDEEVTAGLLWEEHDCLNAVDIDPWAGPEECDCEHVTFSWTPCDGCGSQLGGAREALTVWIQS